MDPHRCEQGPMRKPAIVLLSGGLDSATVLALALREGYEVHAITFDYHQRHRVEIERSRALVSRSQIASHTLFPIDLRRFGGSALTDDIEVPKNTRAEEIGAQIPVTYVPARNLVFLSIAVALAEVRGSTDIFIGVNAVDYSGYPDCRPEFIDAFSKAAGLATRIGVQQTADQRIQIHTPLSGLSKAEIVKLGTQLDVPYELTVSCYDPSDTGEACNRCEACVLRAAGFAQAGLADPASSVSLQAPSAPANETTMREGHHAD